MTAVQRLPESLILLIHLHILQFPHANNIEYDHNVFSPRTRGLRERAKTMEDVAYFLVGRIEGRGVKTILPVYPCLQPSEALAFRTSLTKYLEGLRHQSIYPRAGAKSGDGEMVASWWKDVAVRKSLVEEASGEKFERLMLSLSTHALMHTSHAVLPSTISNLLRSQPIIYAANLARYQSARHAWSRSSSLLVRWEHDLTRLRSQVGSLPLKYATLSTPRLYALAESKRQDLTNRHWNGQHAQAALSFLIELAGLRTSPSSSRPHLQIPSLPEDPSKPPIHPSPLPIAAAHHPSQLKKLKRPLLKQPINELDTKGPSISALPTMSHAEIVLDEHIQNGKRVRQALSNAISRCKKRTLEMRGRCDAGRSSIPRGGVTAPSPSFFWATSPTSTFTFDYEPQLDDKPLFDTLGLGIEFDLLSSDSDVLEKRVDAIRTMGLVPFPVAVDVTAPIQRLQLKGEVQVRVTPRPAPAPQTAGVNSPSKSARSVGRKSVRYSTALRRTGRVSMFRASSGEDEVDRLVDETHDFSTDDEDADDDTHQSFQTQTQTQTPKVQARRTTPRVNRIWTGTPGSRPRPRTRTGGAVQGTGGRPSVGLARLFEMEPGVRLPSMGSLSCSTDEDEDEDEDEVEVEDEVGGIRDVRDADATPMPAKRYLQLFEEDEDEAEEEGDDVLEVPAQQDDQDDSDDVFRGDTPSLSMTLTDILLSTDTSYFDLLGMGSDDMEDGRLVEDASFVWE